METTQKCQVKIKDNHNAFYFGAPSKRPCPKDAVKTHNGTHMCEHHYNRAVKKSLNKQSK